MMSIFKHIYLSALITMACSLNLNLSAQTFSHVTDQVLPEIDINSLGCFAGCGASFFDFNEDGWDDLTFVGIDQPITIYINQGGEFSLFETLPSEGEPKHPIWVDYDNDGDNDLFVSKYLGLPMLYRNDDSAFIDVSTEVGFPLNPLQENFGACWGDYDLDGYLDLYIANFNDFSDDYQATNVLLHNSGDGTFEDLTVVAGVGNGSLKSNGCSWMDFNKDGLPDLHLINDRDYNKNALYLNNGDGTFEDISVSSGADIGIFAMSSTVGDYDNDGWLDVYITNGPLVGNYLLKNINGEVFFQQQIEQNVQAFSMCWSAQWIDYNNDMWQDLYVAVRDWGALPEPNHFFVNNEGSFSVPTEPIFPDDEYIGYANAIADFNNDGHPDLLQYSDGNQPPAIWENSGSDNNYIKLDLTGTISNRNAIGTWVDCYADGVHQVRYTYAGEDYLAQDSQYEIFGLGHAPVVDSLIVNWPNGLIESHYGLAVNQTLELIEGNLAPEIAYEADYLCVGDSIELTTQGFESYLWSNGDTTSTINVASPNWYWVQGVNSSGITITSDSLFISIAFPPTFSIETTGVSCFGENDGSIVFSEYLESTTIFEWPDGSTDSFLENLDTGLYEASVGNGICVSHLSIEIEEPDSLTLEIMATDVSCFGLSDGAAELIISGGTFPFAPDWNLDPSQLIAGDYTVTLVDANLCSAEVEFSISEPELLEGILDFVSLEGGQFLVTADIIGGTQPFDMQWSDGQSGGSITTDEINIDLEVTDANGCLFTEGLNLVLIEELKHNSPTISPNPASDHLYFNDIPVGQSFGVSIFNSLGQLVLQRINFEAPDPLSIVELPSGSYIIKINGTDFAHQQQIIVSR